MGNLETVACLGVYVLLSRGQAAATPDVLWEKLATFGALGIICGWLFIKDYWVGAKERAARHELANRIGENTLATNILAKQMEELSKVIWQLIISRGGALPKVTEEETRRR
jgi:hypothetical protein